MNLGGFLPFGDMMGSAAAVAGDTSNFSPNNALDARSLNYDSTFDNWNPVVSLENIIHGNTTLAQAMKSRKFVMAMIYKMYMTGIVCSAANFRSTMIQIHRLTIDEDEEFEQGVAAKRYTIDYLQPMAWSIHQYFVMFGLCPYRWQKKKMYVGDDAFRQTKYGDDGADYVWIKVPVPLPIGTFEIETFLDDHGNKYDRITDLQGNIIKDVLYSNSREGPLFNDPGFDSECGSLVNDWLHVMSIRSMAMQMQQRELRPTVYVERFAPNAGAERGKLNDEDRLITDFINDEYGIPHPVPPKLEMSQGMMMLPREFHMSGHQPQARMLLDEERAVREFIQLVASRFSVSYRIFNSEVRAGSAVRDSSYVIDEDKSRTTAALQMHIHDIQKALSQLWAEKFGHYGVPVHIPLRPLVSVDQMREMRLDGTIDEEFQQRETLNIIGVHEDHAKRMGRRRKKAKMEKKERRIETRGKRLSGEQEWILERRAKKIEKAQKKRRKEREKSGEPEPNNNVPLNDQGLPGAAEDKTKPAAAGPAKEAEKPKKKEEVSSSSDDSSDSSEDERPKKKKKKETKSKAKKKKSKDSSDSDDSSDSGSSESDSSDSEKESSKKKKKKESSKKKRKRDSDSDDDSSSGSSSSSEEEDGSRKRKKRRKDKKKKKGGEDKKDDKEEKEEKKDGEKKPRKKLPSLEERKNKPKVNSK